MDITVITKKAPSIIVMLGLSPIAIHTQNGPITISSSITKLTIAEVVYRGAMLISPNETGSISTHMVSIVQTGAVNIVPSELNRKPKIPLNNDPIAAAGITSSSRYFLTIVKASANPDAVIQP